MSPPRMKKKNFFTDTLVASVFVVLGAFLIGFFPLKFEEAKPIKQEFSDFDIYDLYYSKLGRDNFKRDADVVLVQVGRNRKEIAEQLLKISSLEPAIVGIDVTFENREDPESSALLSAIRKTPSVVCSYRFRQEESSGELAAEPQLIPDSLLLQRGGYVNLLGTEEYSVVRYYSPFLSVQEKEHMALTSRIVEKYSPPSFEKLRKRGRSVEIINYHNDIENYHHFTTADFDTYYASNKLKEFIKGKIVLLGVFTGEPVVLEDLKFTPRNPVVTGKSFPDMYGVVVQANILTMLMSGDYASLMPLWLSYLLAYIFTFFFIAYIVRVYIKGKHPAHWKLFLIRFTGIPVLLLLFLWLFSWTRIKILLLPVILSLALAVEIFDLYRLFIAPWLHKKFKYATNFSKKEHD